MYTIEETSFGFRITQAGKFSLEDVESYKSDVIRALAKSSRPFSLMIDSRQLVLPTSDVLEVFGQLHTLVWQMSCQRGAIIVESPIARDVAVRACAKSEPATLDRVIDARRYPDWEARALAWVMKSVEPIPEPGLTNNLNRTVKVSATPE